MDLRRSIWSTCSTCTPCDASSPRTRATPRWHRLHLADAPRVHALPRVAGERTCSRWRPSDAAALEPTHPAPLAPAPPLADAPRVRCLVLQGREHAADGGPVTQPPSNPRALPPLAPAPPLADAPHVRALPLVAGRRTCSRWSPRDAAALEPPRPAPAGAGSHRWLTPHACALPRVAGSRTCSRWTPGGATALEPPRPAPAGAVSNSG